MCRHLIFFVLLTLFCLEGSQAQNYPKAFAHYAPRPDYPPLEYRALPRRQWPTGSGIFTVNIDQKTGLVSSASVKKTTGSAALDKTAIDALRRWKFRTPTKPSVDVPMEFKQ
jgi:TonB family protein